MSNAAVTTLESSKLVSGRRRFHPTVAKADAVETADAAQLASAPEAVAGWAATELPAEKVVLLVDDFNAEVRPHTNRWKASCGAGLVLGWLGGLPGDTWQQRWLHAEDAFADRDWDQLTPDGRGDAQLAVAGMGSLIGLDIVRPSYLWLADNSFSSMWKRMGQRRDPDIYAKVTGWAGAAAGRRREAEEALLCWPRSRRTPARAWAGFTAKTSWTTGRR